ncbi:NF038120 family PEP-CTERM protein [Chitinimonas sp. PSY-7]|uniref:NF038120 family PEP-CTERM protein n=1 Tax=Chitinimonas sp. PSY-7 TaxID=3459088 RepID=UPI0040402D4E
MKNVFKKTLIAIAASVAIPAASAAAINFESLKPEIFTAGDSFKEDNYKFTVTGDPAAGGLLGAIGTSATATCSLIDCPVGNDGQFYLGLNDGGLRIDSSVGMGFTLGKFEASFIAPLTARIPSSVAKLVISATDYLGQVHNTSFELPGQNTSGDWEFVGFAFDAPNMILRNISFSACLTDSSGSCVALGNNQAQFGLDNLNVTTVPEPSSALLIALGLAGLGFAYRRKQSV